jgi:lipopolysaccharide heptosyltransferase II
MPVLENNIYIDELIPYSRRKPLLLELYRIYKRLQNSNFSLVIDLQGLARTALFSWLSRTHLRLVVPGARECSWLIEREIAKFNPNQHAVLRNLEVIKYIKGKKDIDLEVKFPLFIKEESYKKVTDFLSVKGVKLENNIPLFGICFGSRNFAKCWPASSFAYAINILASNISPAYFLLIGSRNELEKKEEIKSLISKEALKFIIDVVGELNLEEVMALLHRCTVVISNDSGLLHLAAALEVPTVAIFGPSSPTLVGPYQQHTIVLYKNLPCSPCGRVRPGRRCKDLFCLLSISPKEVADAAMEIILKKN